MDDCRHDSDHDVLVRIDEKVAAIHTRMDTFVTDEEFYPVKLLAFGLTGLLLTGVIAAIIQGVLKRAI